MSIGSGLASQLMMKAESTYGTPVTVDRPFEFVKENIVQDLIHIDSKGLGRGRVLRTDRTKPVVLGHGGDIEFEVLNKNFGLIFQHMLGQNTITGAGANKTHTCILDSLAQQGKAMTVQVGRPDSGGTVRAFTYEGGKITKWELSAVVGEQLKLVTSWDFQAVLTATALATPSYVATQEQFVFAEGAITYGGSAFYTKSFKLSGDSKMVTDRRFMGNVKKEPLAGDFTDIMGECQNEFEDLTYYNNSIAGTTAQMVIAFTLATVIPTTVVPFSLTVTLPAVEFLKVDPNVEGPKILETPLPFRVLDNGTDPVISLVYVTSDTAA